MRNGQTLEFSTWRHPCRVAIVNESRSEIALHNAKGGADELPKMFTFDATYGPGAIQKDIYDRTAAPIVDSVIDGYNGTIFAYGQTGAGKTHTMEGKADDPKQRGIMPNSFKHIFDRIDRTEQSERRFLVRASYLEIYNEEIRDLLGADPTNRLELKENVDSGVYVKDLTSIVVRSAGEIDAVLQAGKKNRVTGATLMNAQSSRSHAIFTVTVETQAVGPDGKEHIRVGKLNMVDLAGSERQSKTGATGQRLKEATKINLSLSALGNVIAALIDSRSTHVPYRDSKLTRLLQDSLGGNTKTVMIANCGPADYNYDETLSTLRYADRAKRIKNKPKINEDPKDAMLREFQEEIERLRRELAEKAAAASTTTIMVDGKEIAVPMAPGETKIIEKVVGMSEEERKKLEAAAAAERAELEKRAEAEREKLLKEKAMTEEEREKLRKELARKVADHDAAEKEREELVTTLQKMQEKLIMGGRLMDKAAKQEAELARAKRELEERKRQEEQLAREQEEANLLMEEQFSTLQEEAVALRRKLKKLFSKYQAMKAETRDLEEEFQREREGLLDMMREHARNAKLKQAILEAFVPPQELERLEASAEWDEETETWSIRGSHLGGNLLRPARGVVTEGAKRPESLFARSRRQYDGGIRFASENIAQLALDPVERTTTNLGEAVSRGDKVVLLDDDGADAARYILADRRE
jgi:kinesin family member 3B